MSDVLRVERHGSTSVVRLGTAYNSLDEDTLLDAEQALLTSAESPEAVNLVVDLSDTRYIGSRFIEALFRAHNRIKRKGGKFVLSGLQAHPAEVIRISKLDLLWTQYPNAESAVQALAT
jgi:anti-anti-sigma factor